MPRPNRSVKTKTPKRTAPRPPSGVLGYTDLRREWQAGKIRFDPDISESQIGLSSIDLRLGSVCALPKPNQGVVVQPARSFDPTNLVERQNLDGQPVLNQAASLRIKSGEFKLAFTQEKVIVPLHVAAAVQGKSGLARAGLAIHITAPTIHPGFDSFITLEMYNHGPWELELFPGDPICQVVYYYLNTPVPKTTAIALGSYLGQTTPFPKRSR